MSEQHGAAGGGIRRSCVSVRCGWSWSTSTSMGSNEALASVAEKLEPTPETQQRGRAVGPRTVPNVPSDQSKPARSARLRLQPVGVQRTEKGTVHLMTHFMTTGNQYSFASANSTQNLPTRSNSATKVRPSPQSAQIASWIPFEGLLLRPRPPFHSSLYPVAAPRFRCYAVVVIRYAELKSAGWTATRNNSIGQMGDHLLAFVIVPRRIQEFFDTWPSVGTIGRPVANAN